MAVVVKRNLLVGQIGRSQAHRRMSGQPTDSETGWHVKAPLHMHTFVQGKNAGGLIV